MSDSGRSETYVDINIKGRSVCALLDSGYERSVCPFRVCHNTKITPVKAELYAANSTPISVVGTARLQFMICGMKMFADVYVSESVDEIILNYDYLEHNNCEWLFGEHRIIISGLSVPLRSRPSKCTVRRIYVREPVVVPSDTSVNVPVRMPFVNLITPKNEWLTEPKEIRLGLLAARTLLSHDDRFAAIAFMNVSGTDQALCKGSGLGMATTCPDANVRLLVKPDLTAEIDNTPEVVIGPTCSDLEDGVTELPPAVDECVNDSDVADNLILPPAPGFADDDDETIVKCASVHTSASTSSDCDGDFAHVQPVINKLPESLTAEQRDKAIELIKRNADIFGRHEFDVGCTNLVTASIITDPGHPPIA